MRRSQVHHAEHTAFRFVGSDGSILDGIPAENLEQGASPVELAIQSGHATSMLDMSVGDFAPFGHDTDFQDIMDDHPERIHTDDSVARATDEDGDNEAAGPSIERGEETTQKEARTAMDDHAGDFEGGKDEPGRLVPSATKKRRKEAPKDADKRTLSVDKARASRDRNREHARNTRIRKKQYLENLKMQVGEMLQAKAKEERDAVLDCSRMSAARAAQRQMVLNVFFLQATEDLSVSAWSSILDEDFTCITPITPFRSFPPSEVQDFNRIISGVHGMIQDTASMGVFIQSIGRRSQNLAGRKVKYQFYTSPDDTVVGPKALMCRWLMRTENATECGAQCEVFSNGMLKACFAPDNRIKSLQLVFDVMSFMQQLQRALGGGEFRVIPNTLESAVQPSRHARLVCSSDKPYWITYVNEAWSALMGHSQDKAKLFTLSVMNGPPEANNGGELDAFIHSCMGVSPKRAGVAELYVITGDLRRIRTLLQLYPLGTADGSLSHFLMVMEEIPMCAALSQTGLDLFPFV